MMFDARHARLNAFAPFAEGHCYMFTRGGAECTLKSGCIHNSKSYLLFNIIIAFYYALVVCDRLFSSTISLSFSSRFSLLNFINCDSFTKLFSYYEFYIHIRLRAPI